MDIQRLGSKPSVKGPQEWFTGSTSVEMLFDARPLVSAAAATHNSKERHIAIQEAQDGSPVEWMEHVTDGDYGE